MAASQPVRASRGIQAGVRNTRGKNSRNELLTAVGLPVRRAIAYGNPVYASPHTVTMATNVTIPAAPVANRTPSASPIPSTGSDRNSSTMVSATNMPSSSAQRFTGVSSSRSK